MLFRMHPMEGHRPFELMPTKEARLCITSVPEAFKEQP